jgi:hypothetical protein
LGRECVVFVGEPRGNDAREPRLISMGCHLIQRSAAIVRPMPSGPSPR